MRGFFDESEFAVEGVPKRVGRLPSLFFTSDSAEWPTPQWLFDFLDKEFHFTLDPCATASNAKCKWFFTKEDNGLSRNWHQEVVFMNPPYGKVITKWMRKAYHESLSGALVVCLIPCRTDTFWFQRYALRGEIRLVEGRLRFEGGEFCAPFPSCVVVFYPPNHKNHQKIQPYKTIPLEKTPLKK